MYFFAENPTLHTYISRISGRQNQYPVHPYSKAPPHNGEKQFCGATEDDEAYIILWYQCPKIVSAEQETNHIPT